MRTLTGLPPILLLAFWLGIAAVAQGTDDEGHLADSKITEAIEVKLRLDAVVSTEPLELSTSEGIVLMSGAVSNLLAGKRAVQIAASVKGVREVMDRIRVKPDHRRSAPEIQADVEEAMRRDPATSAMVVRVCVNEGVVALSGSVSSHAERELAGVVAIQVRGIMGFDNLIEIQTAAERTDDEIAEAVQRRLRGDAWVDAGLIEVEVRSGQVYLTGAVGSLLERNRAYANSWVEGVRGVDTRELKIAWWLRERMQAPRPLTDAEIESAVKEALRHDPRVAPFEPGVEVKKGIVTVSGTVTNPKAMIAVDRAASQIDGVWRVRNRLSVQPDVQIGDDELRDMIEQALRRDPCVGDHDIRFFVRHAKVYFFGNVDNYFEKGQAKDVVSRVAGVVTVANHLSVEYPAYVGPDSIGQAIAPCFDALPYGSELLHYYGGTPITSDRVIGESSRERMFWDPLVDAAEIGIWVNNRVVTLYGRVPNQRAQLRAINNAYDGGALQVLDALDVGPANALPTAGE